MPNADDGSLLPPPLLPLFRPPPVSPTPLTSIKVFRSFLSPASSELPSLEALSPGAKEIVQWVQGYMPCIQPTQVAIRSILYGSLHPIQE